MLKIYLQIFGTIAVCLIILLNYQVFIQKPNKAKITELQGTISKLKKQNEVLDKILEARKQFPKLEQLQFDDYAHVRVFYANDFNEPRFMQRIQKLIDISGCTNNGIIVGKTTKAPAPSKYADFVSKKDEIDKSVKSFLDTMKTYQEKPEKWNDITGPDSQYAKRLEFYKTMGEGKKSPVSMTKGIEIHRFNITVKGNYTNCKKFLWLISRNRPFTQATVQVFAPASQARGTDKLFNLRVTVITYVDKNAPMTKGAPAEAKADVKAENPTDTKAETPAEQKTDVKPVPPAESPKGPQTR